MNAPFAFHLIFEAELLASTVEISNSVNRWFRRSNSVSESGIWIGIFIAIVLLWVGLYFWDRFRKSQKKPGLDREGLFSQLCDLHQLSKDDRQLLRTLAKLQNLDQPALAFVNPSVILNHAQKSPREASDLYRLADRLFGQSLIAEIVSGVSSLESNIRK